MGFEGREGWLGKGIVEEEQSPIHSNAFLFKGHLLLALNCFITDFFINKKKSVSK